MKELRIRATGPEGVHIDWSQMGQPGFKHEVIVKGDFEVEEIDHNAYVQVQFVNGFNSQLYTYIDPSGALAVGDLVDVPTQYEEHNLVVVKRLGDGYKGRSKMKVSGKYLRSDLFERLGTTEANYGTFDVREKW